MQTYVYDTKAHNGKMHTPHMYGHEFTRGNETASSIQSRGRVEVYSLLLQGSIHLVI